MPCIEVKTKKYQSRSSPPYHANECPNETKLGNDGKYWKSVSNSKNIYKWIPQSNNKKITKTSTDSKRGKIYYIHDNQGRPFKGYL